MATALVTGCSSGIGLHTAVELAKDGYATFATMRDTSKNVDLLEAAARESVKVEILNLDVDDVSSISDAVDRIMRQAGRIDVLVNNAGYGQFGTLEDTPISDFKDQFQTNYFGIVSVLQNVLPHMRAQGSGRVVNVGSVAGRMGLPCSPAYISSKFALEGLTECLRYELDQFGIQVTIIEPGVVKTSFFKSMRVSKPGNETYQKMLDHIMSGLQMMTQMGTDPKDVARIILGALAEERMQPRYVAGSDAAMFMNAKNSRTDMEFEQFMKKEVFPQ